MKLPFLTKVQKKLILNYTSLLVGLLALPCGFIYYVIKLNTFEKSTYLVDHTHQVIHQCDQLEKEVQNIEIGYRAFLATQDSSFLKPFFSGKKNLSDIFIRINYLSKDNPPQLKLIDSLHKIASRRLAYLYNKSRVEDSREMAKVLRGGEEHLSLLSSILSQIRANEELQLDQRRIVKREMTVETRISSYAIQFVAFVICCLTSWGVVFYLRKNIQYQKELEQSNSKLILINNELNRLALVATHNLQEPMRKMQVIIDKLQQQAGQELSPQVGESLSTIRKIYQKQQGLNNSIVDYFEILTSSEEQKDIHLHYRITEIAARQKWDFTIQLNVQSTITMGEQHFYVLIKNLVQHSIAHKDPEIPLVITFSERKKKEGIQLVVSDNGKCVDIDEINKTLDTVGTGLSVCRRIMLNYNGNLSIQAAKDERCSVVLEFSGQ